MHLAWQQAKLKVLETSPFESTRRNRTFIGKCDTTGRRAGIQPILRDSADRVHIEPAEPHQRGKYYFAKIVVFLTVLVS